MSLPPPVKQEPSLLPPWMLRLALACSDDEYQAFLERLDLDQPGRGLVHPEVDWPEN